MRVFAHHDPLLFYSILFHSVVRCSLFVCGGSCRSCRTSVVALYMCVVLTMRKMSVTGTIHSFFFILGDQEITEAATKPKSEGIG